MGLAEDFKQVLDSLPADWTDLEIDLRIKDHSRFVDASVMLSMVNGQAYSGTDWDWRLLIANKFGHGAAPESVLGVLAQLDTARIDGELRLRELREGRAEVVQMWGRPESVRREFRQRRAL